MALKFRSSVFDPILIISKIIALQCFFYVTLGIWIILADNIGNIHRSLDQIFDYREFEGTYDGWLMIGAAVLNGFTSAISLWWIVRRAKQSLDFSATVYIVHTVLCLAYGGFPKSLSWWLTNLFCFGVTTIFGEWLCMRSELREIPVGGSLTGGGAVVR